MKGEVSEIYESIKEDLIRLNGNWLQYKQLFTESDEHFEVMNQTSPGFFRLYQDMSVDNAIVVLSRMIDNPRNETLPRLLKLVKNDVHHTIHAEMEDDLEALKAKCTEIVEHRNKRVVHKESAALKVIEGEAGEGAQKLPPINRKMIEGAMRDMADLMNKILGCYESVEQSYIPVFSGGSKALLLYLRKGLEAAKHPPL